MRAAAPRQHPPDVSTESSRSLYQLLFSTRHSAYSRYVAVILLSQPYTSQNGSATRIATYGQPTLMVALFAVGSPFKSAFGLWTQRTGEPSRAVQAMQNRRTEEGDILKKEAMLARLFVGTIWKKDETRKGPSGRPKTQKTSKAFCLSCLPCQRCIEEPLRAC